MFGGSTKLGGRTLVIGPCKKLIGGAETIGSPLPIGGNSLGGKPSKGGSTGGASIGGSIGGNGGMPSLIGGCGGSGVNIGGGAIGGGAIGTPIG
jgi:hypothetical protein